MSTRQATLWAASGAIGPAVLGAVFAARAGVGVRADAGEAVQTVLVAAPISGLALLVVLLLDEAPLDRG